MRSKKLAALLAALFVAVATLAGCGGGGEEQEGGGGEEQEGGGGY